MNVSLKNIDAVSGIVKLEIEKADYEKQVEKSLRSFRQKVNMPGFRKGMVPMGLLKSVYGVQVLVEELNKIVSEKLYNYIQENKLNILGEPMPSETEQKLIDFNTQEDFEFCFDVALAPEIDVELSKNDKLTVYQVVIDDDAVDKQVESYAANQGSYDSVDDVQERDMVKGTVTELENGAPKEGGMVVEDAVLIPFYMDDADEKAKFIGAKKEASVVFNPYKAYEGNESELASFLKTDKAVAHDMTSDFSFEIKEITRHKNAEVNQELFDKVFGEGVVKGEDEFRAKIKEILSEQFVPRANYKFLQDARDVLVKKAGELKFADAMLKRWLLRANDKNTPEKLEEDYPDIIEDLKYQLIKEKLVKENDLKVEDADLEAFAGRVAKAQFVQYGMLSVPDDVVSRYAKDMLKDKNTAHNIIDRAVEEKLADWLKEQVTLEAKEVSVEEFNKLFE